MSTLNMAADADCTDNSFARADPVSGLISCEMTHMYAGTQVQDGSK